MENYKQKNDPLLVNFARAYSARAYFVCLAFTEWSCQASLSVYM